MTETSLAPTGAWEIGIGDYDPAAGTTILHHVGSARLSQIGPDPVSIRRQPIRKDDTSRPLRAGAISRRPDMLSTIYVNCPIEILTDTPENAEHELDALLGAWAPRTLPAWLYVTDPIGQQYAYRGKPRDTMQDEKHVRSSIIYTQLLFEATHPVRYSQLPNLAAGIAGVTGAGFGFPFGFPFGFGTSDSTGPTDVMNVGTSTTWPVVRFIALTDTVGPLIVRDNARDLEFRWDGVLTAGTHLIVDMGEGIVFTMPGGPFELGPISGLALDAPVDQLPDGATLASKWVHRPGSRWIDLPSGVTSLAFSALNGSAVMQVCWRDAWFR
jgi:hypothetical protein